MILYFFAKQWRLKLLWLLVFVVFILGLLLWSRDVDVTLHNQRLELLSDVRGLEAHLDQGALQVASLSLVQYDPLLDVTHGLYGIIEQFSTLDDGFRYHTNRVISRYLDRYSSDLDEKIWLLERIKSRASLVRNGLHYLALVTTELRQVKGSKKDQVIVFLNELYRYTIFPDEVHFNVLQRELTALKKIRLGSAKQQKLLDNVLFHMSSNLASLKILATLKNRYSAVHSVDSFESLQLAYRDFYNASRQRSEQFSYLLWFCILILLWGVTRLVAQLGHSEDNLQMALVGLKKLSLATEQSPISIIITDTRGFIEYVNPHFEQVSGYRSDDVVGHNFSLMQIEDKSKTECVRLWSAINSGKTWQGEVNSLRKDGSLYWEHVTVSALRDDEGNISHYIALKEDISLRKQAEEQVLYQAQYDGLTGLPNRSLMLDRLRQSIVTAKRDRGLMALLFLDLDNFKSVNDTLGHKAGDRLLQVVSQRLQECVREMDTVARFGGDEFVLLLQDIHDVENAALISEKIIHSLADPFQVNNRNIYIGCSIGISLFPEDSTDADQLLQYADMAMYRAKEAGRNNFQFFTVGMQEKVNRNMELEQDLRLALECDQLQLYYQPIMSIAGDEMKSAEALVRWLHPKYGLMLPDEFIPLAEESGLITALGAWVLQQACWQLGVWKREGNIVTLSVNVSSRQTPETINHNVIKSLLLKNGVAAENLVLEITESLFLSDSDEVIRWLTEIKQLGVQLSIDDFGTGYSSLSYLKRFPLDILKVDRAFIKNLPDDRDDQNLVKAILAMAKSMGLKVVAEGVETRQQQQFLQQLQCECVQGHLFSKPLPADQFEAFLLRN